MCGAPSATLIRALIVSSPLRIFYFYPLFYRIFYRFGLSDYAFCLFLHRVSLSSNIVISTRYVVSSPELLIVNWNICYLTAPCRKKCFSLVDNSLDRNITVLRIFRSYADQTPFKVRLSLPLIHITGRIKNARMMSDDNHAFVKQYTFGSLVHRIPSTINPRKCQKFQMCKSLKIIEITEWTFFFCNCTATLRIHGGFRVDFVVLLWVFAFFFFVIFTAR